MRYSMIRLREVTVVHSPDFDIDGVMADLLRELTEVDFDSFAYQGILRDVALELEVEHSVLAQIAENCMGELTVGYSSRMLLENDPLDGTWWRLAEGIIVDLSIEPGLFSKARMLQRVRRVCRMRMERTVSPSAVPLAVMKS